jgi:hypothetical protein
MFIIVRMKELPRSSIHFHKAVAGQALSGRDRVGRIDEIS